MGSGDEVRDFRIDGYLGGSGMKLLLFSGVGKQP